MAAVFFFALVLADMVRRIERAKAGLSSLTTSSMNPNEATPVLRSLVVLPDDSGILCLALLITPAHTAFRVVYSALLAASVVFVAAGCARWYREMRSMTVPVGVRGR